MSTRKKWLFVAAGYLLAIVIACAAVWLHRLMTNDADAQSASGMYACGDLLLFLFVCGVASIPPTVAALWMLVKFFRSTSARMGS